MSQGSREGGAQRENGGCTLRKWSSVYWRFPQGWGIDGTGSMGGGGQRGQCLRIELLLGQDFIVK